MDTQRSSKFFVGSLIIFLIIFGSAKVILATMQNKAKQVVTAESMADKDVVARIKPSGNVHIGDAPVIVAVAEETNQVSAGGEQIVSQVCALCHRSGMMNAPKLGDADDWAPRIEKGIKTLYNSAINGLNMMPARGGRPDISDDDIKAAVDHMLSLVNN